MACHLQFIPLTEDTCTEYFGPYECVNIRELDTIAIKAKSGKVLYGEKAAVHLYCGMLSSDYNDIWGRRAYWDKKHGDELRLVAVEYFYSY